MQISPRTIIALVSVLALGFVGSCGYAKSTMTESTRQFRMALSSSGYERGGRPPTEEEAVDRVTSMAQERGLTVRDVSVSTEDYAGFSGMLGGQQAGQALSNALNIRSRRYLITGTVRAAKWLWSTEQAIDTSFSVRLEVTMAPSIEQNSAGQQMHEVQSDSVQQQRGM